MRTDPGSLMSMMIVSTTVLLLCAYAALAQDKKPADPFVKGAKPAVKAAEMPAPSSQEQPIVPGIIRPGKPPMVTAKVTAGEVTTESASEAPDTPIAPQQIEVEVQFVAFDLTNVEKLVASGGLNIDSLTKLWINGGGHLLAAPRVVTPAGAEAVVKGVTECIYPTTFTVSTGEKAGDTTSGEPRGTNTSAAATMNTQVARGPVVVPESFETREVGAILTVLAEVNESDSMIRLTLRSELVEEPIWRDYGSKYLDSNGKEQQARMEQPFFQTYTLSTSIAVANGQRMLIGGGTLSRDRKQMVFIFVTARKVGIRGESIK